MVGDYCRVTEIACRECTVVVRNVLSESRSGRSGMSVYDAITKLQGGEARA